jgi:hypothetical protein
VPQGVILERLAFMTSYEHNRSMLAKERSNARRDPSTAITDEMTAILDTLSPTLLCESHDLATGPVKRGVVLEESRNICRLTRGDDGLAAGAVSDNASI